MSSEQNSVSISEIKRRYYGEHVAENEGSRKTENNPRKNNYELTPSAQYILGEAKKRLATEDDSNKDLVVDENALLKLVQHIESIEGEELSPKERTAAIAALSASLEHYDILQPLLENKEINDIIIRAYNDISIQIGRRNIQTDLTFACNDSYKAFIENILKRAGKSCTIATPVVDAAVDPHIRACVTHESFSPKGSGPMLTLRITRHNDISLEDLAKYELAPEVILDYLGALTRSGAATILIAGEVGTGKTTLVRGLASRMNEDEAILIIEDTNELILNRRFVRTLLTREANTEGAGRISPAQAIRTGMRMAMNRVILGEMRDAEAAEAFIDVCASGHAGMSTIHARSARDALARLELFLSRAQGTVPIETIRRQISNAISVVVFLGLDTDTRRRRIKQVIEVGNSADGLIQLSPIFSFIENSKDAQWKRDHGISAFSELLEIHKIVLPKPGFILGAKTRVDSQESDINKQQEKSLNYRVSKWQ